MREWINIINESFKPVAYGYTECRKLEGNDFLSIVIEDKKFQKYLGEHVTKVYIEDLCTFDAGNERWAVLEGPGHTIHLDPLANELFGLKEGTALSWNAAFGILRFNLA